jgi:hypothetical protein
LRALTHQFKQNVEAFSHSVLTYSQISIQSHLPPQRHISGIICGKNAEATINIFIAGEYLNINRE